MELSIREAKARFAEAAAAAARGERVVATRHGIPFVELVAVKRGAGMDFEKAARIRRELGLKWHSLHISGAPQGATRIRPRWPPLRRRSIGSCCR